MATISSTTPPPTATPVKSTASVNSSAASALLNSLNTGSGIDTTSLVSSLVEAQFAAKRSALTTRYDTLTSQISAASTLKSNISDFAKAFETLSKSGSLASQPVVSNGGVLAASTISGASIGGLSASVSVTRLATAQAAVSGKIADPAKTYDTGKLTLRLGTATYDSAGALNGVTVPDADGNPVQPAGIDITIDGTNNTLAGIAAAINAKNAGVTATVVTDADGGAFLSLKGATGTAQAFTLTADTSAASDTSLAQFNVGADASGSSRMGVTSQAGNAKLSLDGVPVERTTNEVSDLVAGVKLTLANTGTTTLTATRPTSALTGAVNDFVETYNQVVSAIREQTDPMTGVLRADPGAKTLLSALQGLTSRVLLPNAAANTPSSLAGIGVRTNRDGSLSVDTAALTAAMAANPDAIEAMFAPSQVSKTGLLQAMNTISRNATSTTTGLGASATKYRQAQSDITTQQDKIADQATALTTRLTQQFSSMNARVAAYKQTQSFMQQQIDAWSKSDG